MSTSLLQTWQKAITQKVRTLRKERRWTQTQLAHLLNISQNRLSEIESGKGSFTAEQLIAILKNFNVTIDYFISEKNDINSEIQNTLARLGASYLTESRTSLPSERIKNVSQAILEILSDPKSPRLVTALAPAIVYDSSPSLLNSLRIRLQDSGLAQRWGWLLSNILIAIDHELDNKPAGLTKERAAKYQTAEGLIKRSLSSLHLFPGINIENNPDVFDPNIISEKSIKEVSTSRSKISKKWNIVTRIQPNDFVQALRESDEIN